MVRPDNGEPSQAGSGGGTVPGIRHRHSYSTQPRANWPTFSSARDRLMRSVILRTQPQGLIVTGQGLVGLAQIDPGHPGIIVGFRRVGVETEGALEVHQRLDRFVLFQISQSQVAVSCRGVGPQPDGVAEMRRRFGVTPQSGQHRTQIVMRTVPLWREFHGAAQCAHRHARATLLEEFQAGAVVLAGDIRRNSQLRRMPSSQAGQFFRHLGKNILPIARAFLPKQAHGRIPGRVLPIAEPAPVRRQGQRQPDRNPQSACQMSDRGVHRNDQVQVGHHRGGFREVRPLLDSHVRHGKALFQFRPLFGARSLLETHETGTRHLEQGLHLAKADRTNAVSRVLRVALPN